MDDAMKTLAVAAILFVLPAASLSAKADTPDISENNIENNTV